MQVQHRFQRSSLNGNNSIELERRGNVFSAGAPWPKVRQAGRAAKGAEPTTADAQRRRKRAQKRFGTVRRDRVSLSKSAGRF